MTNNTRRLMTAHALPENAATQLAEWLTASHGFYTAYILGGDQAGAATMAAWAEDHAAAILAEAAAQRQRRLAAWRSN